VPAAEGGTLLRFEAQARITMARIAVGGFHHETNCFVQPPTGFEYFTAHGLQFKGTTQPS
jgi:hypothetical protein